MGIVLLPVLFERGMFFEQFWCKTEILLKYIFMPNSYQSAICTFINLFSWITVERVYVMYQQDHWLSCQLCPTFPPAWKEQVNVRL